MVTSWHSCLTTLKQSLLAAEPGIDRRFRTADDLDDVVDRNVVVAMFQEQRRRHANNTFSAGIGALDPARTARGAPRVHAPRALRASN
jgi:hypothetical protein